MMGERAGWRQNSERTMARTPFARGRRRGPESRPGVIRWLCARPMKKATRSLTSRSGIQEGICGTGSRGRKSRWEMRAKGRASMKNRVRGIFPVVCSLAMAAVVYAEFKKGYYSPAELGSLRQAAPIQLLPAATWEAEVEKMNKTFGAAIPEDNTKRITLYLEAHYTTDNRKQ